MTKDLFLGFYKRLIRHWLGIDTRFNPLEYLIWDSFTARIEYRKMLNNVQDMLNV